MQLGYEQVFDRMGMTGYRYGILLITILTSLVFQLAAPEADWARLVTILLQGLTLLMALVASRVHPWVLRAATIAVCLAVVGSTAALIGFGQLGPTGARLLTALMVALAPLSIARGVIIDVKANGVTLHTMFGVLCIYLLLGILFAFAYGIVGVVGSGSFFQQHAAESTKNFLYFSFVTITTVGYGDLTPGTHLGQSLAIAEALVGQIYLVTVVAAIVGGLGGTRRTSKP
jgi:ion channel